MQMSIVHEYWRHTETGHLWAVKMVDDEVVAASGPLDDRDVVPALLPYLPYVESDAVWVTVRRRDFAPATIGRGGVTAESDPRDSLRVRHDLVQSDQ